MSDLIIGGSGFIGRNLAVALRAQGREVTVVDRVPDVTKTFTGQFIEGDAQDAGFLTDVLAHVSPTTVYHFAANSDISAGVLDASLDFGDTLMTSNAVRIAASRIPIPELVFASSSAIFGPIDGPISEEPMVIPQPVSWYGKAKLASEFILESLCLVDTKMRMLFVRFPNVVGPLATHGVVYDFVRKLTADPHHLQVLGDGNQTKPYVHVSDLLEGIEFFRRQLQPGITKVNIGPTELIDVKGIVAEVCSVLKVDPAVSYQESPYGWPGDVPRYEFDTTKMTHAGFQVTATSRDAVRRAASELALEWSVR